jgi:hypothetical protein
MKKLLFMKFLFLILTCVLAGCSKTSGVRQGTVLCPVYRISLKFPCLSLSLC